MRRLIAELPIGPHRIALFETDDPLDNGTASAIWDAEAKSITLDASLVGSTRWVFLIHEIVHAVSDLYDLEIDKEHVCSTLGNGFVQALAGYLPRPPVAIPPVPQIIDDDTPEIVIKPITRAEDMP